MVRTLLLLIGIVALSGCAGPVERWIVDTRVHQGDVALADGDVQDAQLAYQLALRVDPTDARARAGFVDAAAAYAQVEYEKGTLDDALATLSEAAAYDPQSVRLQSLRSTIEQARLNREIVIANYPTYRTTAQQIEKAYVDLDLMRKGVLKSLKRFDYTYDTQDLTQAIEDSYELQLDVAKNTNRLITYRQLVESGVPASHTTSSGAAGSLLPLP